MSYNFQFSASGTSEQFIKLCWLLIDILVYRWSNCLHLSAIKSGLNDKFAWSDFRWVS